MIVNTVTEAKANLSALLERVQNGETIILGKNGKPIAFDETPDEILKFFKGENE